MSTIKNLIESFKESESASGILFKTMLLKKAVLSHIIKNKRSTIAELALQTNTSIPKINEIILELLENGVLMDLGKELNGVGRKPNFYGVNPKAAYLLSVEVNRYSINIAIVDFNENLIEYKGFSDYILENNSYSYELLCTHIDKFLHDTKVSISEIIGLGLTITGRVNQYTGNSYSYFNFLKKSISESLSERFNLPTMVENDTRAMAFGEYNKGVVQNEDNILFLNLDDGIGMGIIVNGQLYSGKSGYSGEFGHLPILANDIICHCGKKGCLETEVSGLAIVNQVKEELIAGTTSLLHERYNLDEIKIKQVVEAALKDDTLSIDLISKAGEKIGKGVAILLNLFNPELIILGGELSNSKSLILLPILSSINKHSLNLVNTDTEFKYSVLGNNSGLIGIALLLRNKLLAIS